MPGPAEALCSVTATTRQHSHRVQRYEPWRSTPPSSLASNTRTRHKHEQQLNCQQREKMLLKAGCDVRLYFHPATPMGGPGKGSVCPGPQRAAAASAAPHRPALAGCPPGPPLSRCSSLPGRQTPSIVLGCWGDCWTTGDPNSTRTGTRKARDTDRVQGGEGVGSGFGHRARGQAQSGARR